MNSTGERFIVISRDKVLCVTAHEKLADAVATASMGVKERISSTEYLAPGYKALLESLSYDFSELSRTDLALNPSLIHSLKYGDTAFVGDTEVEMTKYPDARVYFTALHRRSDDPDYTWVHLRQKGVGAAIFTREEWVTLLKTNNYELK